MSVYAELLEAVSNGQKFKVDLINKSLWINRKQYIKEGEIVYGSDCFIKEEDLDKHWKHKPLSENPWEWIEFLYDRYKYSVPRENSNKQSYFKALSVDELTDSDLAYNEDRDLCDAILTGYILLSSLQGWLKWEYGNNWFWQGFDKDLVVLKCWL